MYECIAKCPELDYDGTPHCRCSNLCVENGGEQNG